MSKRIRAFLQAVPRVLFRRDGFWGIGELLDQADPRAQIPEQLLWMEKIVAWLLDEGDAARTSARFRYLKSLLEQNSDRRDRFQRAAADLLTNVSYVQFFSVTGYAAEHGLLVDIAKRLLGKFVPLPRMGELREVLASIPTTQDSLDAFAEVPLEVIQYLQQLIEDANSGVRSAVIQGRKEALWLLATQIAHHGLAEEIRIRLGERGRVTNSPFLQLAGLIATGGETKPQALASAIEACERAIGVVYANMEASGVSVGLVHRLELLSAELRQLARLGLPNSASGSAERIRALCAHAVEADFRSRSIRAHLRQQVYLLSRKIAERNGYSGEHYSNHTAEERQRLFLSALAGGTIVVLMTLAKEYAGHWPIPPFFMMLLTWGIYSAGFLSMQFTGATLATKLPSFTASHLAARLREARTRHDLDPIFREIRSMLLSQSIALIGNVLGVFALVFPVGWALGEFANTSAMNARHAWQTLEGFHPAYSLALVLGALTGLELWLSSLCGGWFENWVVFRRIPDAIAHHPRLRRVLSARHSKAFAEWFQRNASGMAANVSLGALFAMVPLIGRSVGLNLVSKHVTIATASSVLAAYSLRGLLPEKWWIPTVVGLFGIGFMNLAVSFALALAVATRAQAVRRAWTLYFLREIFRRRKRPNE